MGTPQLAALGERVAQRLLVFQPAAAQHVLLRGHAMFRRGVEELLPDPADDLDGLRVAGVHDARHGQRRHVGELDLHRGGERRGLAHDAHDDQRAAFVHEEFPGDLPREHRQRKLRDPAGDTSTTRACGCWKPPRSARRQRRWPRPVPRRAGWQPPFSSPRCRQTLRVNFTSPLASSSPRKIRHGAEHARETEDARQQLVLEHAVLHGERVVEAQVSQRVQRLHGIDGLGGDDQRAGLAQLLRIVDDGGTRLDVRQPIEHQALALQRARTFAAHDHRDFVSGARQVRAENGAERAGAENGKFHGVKTWRAAGSVTSSGTLSNQARMLSTLAMRLLGRAVMPCEASGMRTITVSTLRSFSAW